MPESSPPLSVDELRNQLEAERLLATLDVAEDLAILADDEPSKRLRGVLRQKFVDLIGVPPEMRRTLKAGLERILEDPTLRISMLLADINDTYVKGEPPSEV